MGILKNILAKFSQKNEPKDDRVQFCEIPPPGQDDAFWEAVYEECKKRERLGLDE